MGCRTIRRRREVAADRIMLRISDVNEKGKLGVEASGEHSIVEGSNGGQPSGIVVLLDEPAIFQIRAHGTSGGCQEYPRAVLRYGNSIDVPFDLNAFDPTQIVNIHAEERMVVSTNQNMIVIQKFHSIMGQSSDRNCSGSI